MTPDFKIVGVLRFSVLTPTYYAERFDGLDAIAAHLFAPDRMALRFRIFEHLVLPCLAAQTDPDFQMNVLTAERMPMEYRDRLAAALKDLPHIHLRTVGPDKHNQIVKAGYRSVDLEGASHRVMFRLDDDDAVDLDYIGRLRRTARGLMQMQPPDVPQIMSFNRGFYVRVQDGDNEVFAATERAPLSAGTALLAPADYPRTPYRYNHRRLAQHYNTYSDITTPAFIRTIHGDNKSNPTPMGMTLDLDDAAMAAQLQTHFGLSLSDLKAL